MNFYGRVKRTRDGTWSWEPIACGGGFWLEAACIASLRSLRMLGSVDLSRGVSPWEKAFVCQI